MALARASAVVHAPEGPVRLDGRARFGATQRPRAAPPPIFGAASPCSSLFASAKDGGLRSVLVPARSLGFGRRRHGVVHDDGRVVLGTVKDSCKILILLKQRRRVLPPLYAVGDDDVTVHTT